MIWDLVIIGGGPVGSFAGYLSSKNNIKTLILEEHNEIGKPLHCLGKLSVHAFNEFPLPKEPIKNILKGGYFFFPNGNFIKLKKEQPDSFILDRSLFDKMLAEKAEKYGCQIMFSNKAIGLEKEKDYTNLIVVEKSKIKKIPTKTIINAEGARRQFLKKIGLKQRPYLISLQYEVSGIYPLDKECVEVYIGEQFSKGFFIWVSPYVEGVKIGVAVNPNYNPKEYIDKFLQNILRKRVSSKFEIKKSYGGIIPICGPYEEYIYPNLLIIGDAAGYNKSTTGGGIYFGLQSAQIAIEQIKRYLETGNLNYLKYFPKLTRNKFGKELIFTKILRKFLNKLNDKELNEIYDLFKSEELLKALENFGDTAYQTTILKILPYLLKNRNSIKLFKLAPKLLESLF
ncbi:MAG: geranylgeranyl reductase family protein [Dictyoglomus sp.]